MDKKAQEAIDLVQQLEGVDEARKDEIIDKLNEWKSDSNAESNSLAVRFEKFWSEQEPIFAEIGLA